MTDSDDTQLDPQHVDAADASSKELSEEEIERRKSHFRRVNLLGMSLSVTILITVSLLWMRIAGAAGIVFFTAPVISDTHSVAIPDSIPVVTRKDRLTWGDNIASVLSRNLTDPEEMDVILPLLGNYTNLRKIPVETQLTISRDELGLKELVVRLPKSNERIHLDRTGRRLYAARVDTLPIDTLLVRFEGVVKSNFYDSFIETGGNAELAVKFIEVFQFVYFFASETRVGDRYSFIAEELWQEGKKIGYDDILVASYINQNDTLTAVWKPMKSSPRGGEHFDKDGKSLRRNLLRIPFSAARITSVYGVRKHPISGKIKFHHGVDLASKMGTPIVASGDGVVTIVGYNHPGYGIWLHIRHDRTGFETRYGHMSKIARGIKKGTRVRQGQVIGYVGMTGHATGPHLHYEVFRDGRRMNPLRIKGSPVQQLEGVELAEFIGTTYAEWELRLFSRGVLPAPQYQGPLPADVEAALQPTVPQQSGGTAQAPPDPERSGG